MIAGLGAGVGTPARADPPSPRPGVLYVELEGAVLRPCEEGEVENAAIGCSQILPREVVLPGYGSDRDRAAVLQSLRDLFDHVDLTITDQPPPPWLPYTLAAVGGSSDLLDLEPGTCGWAPSTCGGRKRNRINFTFPFACTSRLPGRIAAVIAQESGHNFGLEHADAETDVMFPTLTEDQKSFEDRCLPVIPTRDAVACPDEHRVHCPDGAGEEQNGYQELLAVFGPRVEDTEPPVIRSMVPADGAVFGPDDTILLSARIEEETGALGVRWSFTDGPEATIEAAGRDRCTNGVCRWPYGDETPLDADWHFVELVEPEIGVYGARLELMDMDGNYTAREIRFEVRDGGAETGGVATGTTTAGEETTGDGGGTGSDTDRGEQMDGGATAGCACDGTSGPFGGTWPPLLVMAAGRRRRKTGAVRDRYGRCS